MCEWISCPEEILGTDCCTECDVIDALLSENLGYVSNLKFMSFGNFSNCKYLCLCKYDVNVICKCKYFHILIVTFVAINIRTNC